MTSLDRDEKLDWIEINARFPQTCLMFLCDSSETVADMTESWSTEDVDNAVLAISVILKRFGALPQVLLNAYKHEIKIGEPAVTRRFYEQLVVNCPHALDLFTISIADALKTKTDRPKGALRKIPIE
jgi:hypothetical protein